MDAAYPLKRGGVGSLRIVLEIRLALGFLSMMLFLAFHDAPIGWGP